MDVRLLLIERAGCHLCDAGRRQVELAAARTYQPWRIVDVDDSPDLQEAWGELVPVALVDGVEVGHWHLDADRIVAALARTP